MRRRVLTYGDVMPMFRQDSFDFHFERSGTGPQLLFCNGSGAAIARSEPLLNVFRRQFDLAVHDQRGLGQTGLRTDDLTIAARDNWTMADYASDALAFADHLGWDTFALVGVSFGGMVAQELAVTAPGRVSRLALVCTSSGGPGGSSFPLHELRARLIDEPSLALTLADSRFDAAWLAEHPRDAVIAEARRTTSARVRTPAEDVGERLQLVARSHHDVWDRLRRIACPTLVASGRFDLVAPVSNGQAIASQIPGAEFRSYEGGHSFFFQDRAAFPDICAFLAATDPTNRPN